MHIKYIHYLENDREYIAHLKYCQQFHNIFIGMVHQPKNEFCINTDQIMWVL